MRRFLLSVLPFLCIQEVFAQQIPLINSGEIIRHSSILQDSSKFDVAITELLRVPKRDTNYVWANARLAELYNYNKQFDEAIAAADLVLKRPSRFKATMYSIKANVLESRKEYDQAINLLQSALKDYPFSTSLRYRLATCYHNKLDYTNAVKAYYDVLEISPYSYNAHLNLGVIAMWTGHKTQAILSYAVYLALNNVDNDELRTLESICSNQAENEGGAKERAGVNAFEKLDQIIRAKIAMDEKFKTQVPVDAALVKQIEMLMQQLNTVSTTVEDPWVKFYVPLYQTLRDKKMIEPFLYYILSSSSIEVVKKWNSKNEKAKEAFFEIFNATIARDRQNVRTPASLGLGATTHAEYDDENKVSGLGAVLNGKENGPWIYYHPNAEKSAEGAYENGVKKGVWNYYTNRGIRTSTENQDTGEITTWSPDGGRDVHYFLKNEDIEGDIVFYYPCGSVSERRTHKDGKRVGKGQTFYENGTVKSEFEYADGMLANVWVDYDEFGKVKGRMGYKEGKRHGVSETFWSNGKLKDREMYVDGTYTGPSEGFHDNGQPGYKGTNAKDLSVGEWLYYDRNGRLTERRFYNNEGERDGESIIYNEGKVHSRETYVKGMVSQIIFYDKSGKEIWKGGSPDGNFDGKIFYASGQIRWEGKYKKGLRDGKWTQYYLAGPVHMVYNYKDGKYDGLQTDYFRNGKKKLTAEYKDGSREGYYQEFHNNGSKMREGWYAQGTAQQQWIYYHPDGSIGEDLYYLNEKLVDSAYVYSPEGRMADLSFYEDGEAVVEVRTDPTQTIYIRDTRTTEPYEFKYANGTTQTKYATKCGRVYGDVERFYPDGAPRQKFSYVGGLLHGLYKSYDELGNMDASGRYVGGKQSGLWTSINKLGKPDQQIHFINGEIDSVFNSYYEHGVLLMRAEYRQGQRHGLVQFLAPNGVTLVEKVYDQGQIAMVRAVSKSGEFGEWMPMSSKMSVVAYYAGGLKAYEETYENGLLNGPKRIWYPDGKLCMEYNYEEGESEGPFTDFYPGGKVLMKGKYHLDLLDGMVEVFSEDGKPLITNNYKQGRKSGTCTVYSKGVKVKEIEYYNDAPMK